MEHCKLNDIWRIIKYNHFEIDNEMNNDLLCTLCKKLLVNAHSGPCGCRYCFECINTFLNRNEAYCPGNMDECKEEVLNLHKNVHIEQSINRKISKLIVKCPEKDCEFKDELRKIESHIRVCNFGSANCPYFNIGCKQFNIVIDDIKNHLLLEIVSHSKLLLEWIDTLKNEMALLKKDVLELKDENKSLKEEVGTIKLVRDTNQVAILELERKEQMNSGEIDELNQEMVFLKNENRILKDEMKNLMIDRKNEKKITAELSIKEVEEMKQKWEKTENKQEEMEIKINELQYKNSYLIKKSDNQDEIIKNIIDTKINYLLMKMIEMETNTKKEILCEFEWKIENFYHKWYQEEVNTKIYSDEFYSHEQGYKMCLCLNPNGHFTSKRKSLCIDFHLMQGKFDNDLSWPFKHDVTIDLINQDSGMAYTSIPIKYEDCPNNEGWNKPKNNRNIPISFIRFINMNQLLKNSSLYQNDQILIKCKVKTVL